MLLSPQCTLFWKETQKTLAIWGMMPYSETVVWFEDHSSRNRGSLGHLLHLGWPCVFPKFVAHSQKPCWPQAPQGVLLGHFHSQCYLSFQWFQQLPRLSTSSCVGVILYTVKTRFCFLVFIYCCLYIWAGIENSLLTYLKASGEREYLSPWGTNWLKQFADRTLEESQLLHEVPSLVSLPCLNP